MQYNELFLQNSTLHLLTVHCRYITQCSTVSNLLLYSTISCVFNTLTVSSQGIRIKGMEMALIWHEKTNRNALQTGFLFLVHASKTLSYLNPTVKEGAEQYHQLL